MRYTSIQVCPCGCKCAVKDNVWDVCPRCGAHWSNIATLPGYWVPTHKWYDPLTWGHGYWKIKE